MTETTDDGGVTFTVTSTGLTVPFNKYENRVAYRGDVIHLTAQQVEDTKNRDGVSWLDLTEQQQTIRWGMVKFKIGDHSEGITYADDDPHGFRSRAYQRATEYAKKVSDPAERAAALAQVAKDYPEQRTQTQWTLRAYS